MTTTTLKAERDALVREVLSHTLGQIEANVGGWAADRFEAIGNLDADLMEVDEAHRGFKFGPYRARLERAGKGGSFRPVRRFR